MQPFLVKLKAHKFKQIDELINFFEFADITYSKINQLNYILYSNCEIMGVIKGYTIVEDYKFIHQYKGQELI